MNELLSGRRLTFWTTAKLLWHLPTLLRTLFRLLRDARVNVAHKALFLGALVSLTEQDGAGGQGGHGDQ